MVAGISIFIGAVLCYCTGLSGYIAFRSATEGDILDNFSGPLAACFKILVVVHLIMCIPGHVGFTRKHSISHRNTVFVYNLVVFTASSAVYLGRGIARWLKYTIFSVPQVLGEVWIPLRVGPRNVWCTSHPGPRLQ